MKQSSFSLAGGHSDDPAPQVVRALIAIAAVTCLATLAALLFVTRVQLPGAFVGGLISAFVFAALVGIATAIAQRGHVQAAVALTLGAMLLGVTLFAWLSNLGIHTLMLGAFGLTVLVAGVVMSIRAAVGFALACVVSLVGMYFGELQGWLPGPQLATQVPSMSRLVTHLLLMSVSLMFAWLLARIVRGSLEGSRRQEERFRALFVRSPLASVIHRGWRIELANDAAARLFGFDSTQAMTGLELSTFDDSAQRGTRGAFSAAAENLAVGETLRSPELRLRCRDGQQRIVDVEVMRIQQPNGPANLSVYLDLTDRKHAETQLAHSEALLSRVFEASVDSIMVASVSSGRIELVNQRFSDLIGIPAADAVDRTTIELGMWSNNSDREQFVAQLRQGGQVRDYPVRMRRSNGEVRSVHVSASVFQHDGEAHSVSIVRDVTQIERDRLEQAAILDNASVGIAFTRNRRFELANARFEEMFGWPRGLIHGQPGDVVWPSAADYDEIGHLAGPSLARGDAVEFERQVRRRDGSLFWCFLRGRAVDSLNPADGGTIWIAEDITQRRAADAALAAAKEAAEAASRAKSMFLANTSHEIRTPLNGVLGLARLALEPGVDPEVRCDYLRRIYDSAETLSAIITDILDLSKIEAGKLTLETTVFDLHALLNSVFTGYRDVARAKGLGFDLAIAGTVTRHVAGDPVRVRQILSNFVSNAIKFTTHGQVVIDVRRSGDGLVRFTVSDTGIGIDAATRMRLFSPFTQADASTTRRFGGTGLGLSICRQLAELMGGRVGLDSEAGAGSTFHVDLPLAAATTPVVASETGLDAESDLTGLRMLVVEDNPVNMLIVDTLLKSWGVVVEQATDGSQAIAAVDRAGGFAAVLMDVHMPIMSGHEATRELRKRYAKEDLPIVALTAAALASEQAQSLALGMNDFVSKPFDAKRLLNVLLQVTAHRRKSIARA